MGPAPAPRAGSAARARFQAIVLFAHLRHGGSDQDTGFRTWRSDPAGTALAVSVAVCQRENEPIPAHPAVAQAAKRRQQSAKLKPQALFGWNLKIAASACQPSGSRTSQIETRITSGQVPRFPGSALLRSVGAKPVGQLLERREYSADYLRAAQSWDGRWRRRQSVPARASRRWI